MTTGHADAVRALASLVRAGGSLRLALYRWPDELSGSLASEARTLARRIRLGCPVVAALEGLSLGPRLKAPFELHLTEGLDLATWLDRTVKDIEADAVAAASAEAAGAGAVLSGRMVAGLPLLFLPLAPMSRAPILDALGVALLGTGLVLTLVGLRWIGRLVPGPPAADPVADFCRAVTALLEAGSSLPVALRVACEATAWPVARAPRLVRLGHGWPAAIEAADAGFHPVAVALERSFELGAPVAAALHDLAASRDTESTAAFERTMRRAPVLMVVPLVCCVLPAFGLLAIAPFLRSLSLG